MYSNSTLLENNKLIAERDKKLGNKLELNNKAICENHENILSFIITFNKFKTNLNYEIIWFVKMINIENFIITHIKLENKLKLNNMTIGEKSIVLTQHLIFLYTDFKLMLINC